MKNEMNIQPVLLPVKGVWSDLSIYTDNDKDELYVMLGLSILEKVKFSEERLEYKLLIGRLANAGYPLSYLSERFGHDTRTIKKWARGVTSSDIKEMSEIFLGRKKCKKLDPLLYDYIKWKYKKLKNIGERRYNKIIREEIKECFNISISRESLRKIFRETDKESEEKKLLNSCAKEIKIEGETRKYMPEMNEEVELSNNEEEVEIYGKELFEYSRNREGERLYIHELGLIIFLLLFFKFYNGLKKKNPIYMQWISQILSGAVTVEQSRLKDLDSIRLFTGQVCKGLSDQRRELKKLSTEERVIDIYRSNYRNLVSGKDKEEKIFYYDSTAHEYTGQLKILKGWHGGRHRISKNIYMDMFHTKQGQCCLSIPYTAYYDLRERFFMSCKILDKLFEFNECNGRTFIIDRGIYGYNTIMEFVNKQDYLITWEKGFNGVWPEKEKAVKRFTRYKHKNSYRDKRVYTFEYIENKWDKNPDVRRIIVKALNYKGNEITVSILCTNRYMNTEDVIWLMFTRWIQENSFKYLNKHFGVNQLTTYKYKNFSDVCGYYKDKLEENRNYKNLKKQISDCETNLAKKLLKREKLQKKLTSLDQQIKTMELKMETIKREPYLINNSVCDIKTMKQLLGKLKRQKKKTYEQLETLKQTISEQEKQRDHLEKQLLHQLKYTSKISRLISEHFKIIDFRPKLLMDSLRITASNMFFILMNTFRPLYNNFRDDHEILRHISRLDGFICYIDNTFHIQLDIKGMFSKKTIDIFNSFLNIIAHYINKIYFYNSCQNVEIYVSGYSLWNS